MKGILGCVLLLLMQTGFAQGNMALITPDDGDSIETKNPLLVWSYMSGLTAGNDRIYYRLVLVELKKDQSAEAGIIVNQPMLLMDRVPGTQLFYPYDAPELKQGIWYGWQVQKISDQVVVDKSEARKFILPLKIETQQYYKMKFKNDGIDYVVEDGTIRFEFTETYAENALKYYLYNAKDELMDAKIALGLADDDDPSRLPLKRTGSNYYEIELGKYVLPEHYTLVVIDGKKQRYEMKFIVK